jgi:hypothetical protein
MVIDLNTWYAATQYQGAILKVIVISISLYQDFHSN